MKLFQITKNLYFLDRMNLLGYTTGRIEFQADGDLTPTRNFSDRSILHLYYHDSNEYSLNALDLDNNKAVQKLMT